MDNLRKVLCAKCNLNLVIKKSNIGTRPCCADCIAKSVRGRLDRQNEKRRNGKSGHYDANGNRYPEKFIPTEEICHYCFQPFVRNTKRNGRTVCPSCSEKRKEEFRVKGLGKINQHYKENTEAITLRRISLTCARMGLGPDWYDLQPKKCGICGTDKPGGIGRWHIDHDHDCCPPGVRSGCQKCVRGLLCHYCNIGLGCLKESPDILRAAIRWLKNKPVTMF